MVPPPLRKQSGQAAVESAIILPLFVFLILGTLQLGLMHQARLLTKYAAYKAVRAGSLHNAKVEKMEAAALAVLLPILSARSGGANGAEYVRPVGSGQEFAQKWNELRNNKMQGVDLKYAEVTICGPSKEEISGSDEFDFDLPGNIEPSGWRQNHRTKLRIQVTLNYRLVIPFADWVIYQSARAREIPMMLRMGKVKSEEQDKVKRRKFGGAATGESPYESAAGKGVYIMPIRATYNMRMQSAIYLNSAPIPDKNACILPFSY
ncbi:pilus assembly protein [Myxococcus sp. K15C18031901]|uniref:TadE/TadG family type IV pilus assembly protein n=1 Tax=Myxococcus dinghuensis TaxID=2906761 RepID=UPI0020A810E5|nr:TadE family protein [Myxococcus dinghuensis]MCP3104573.1 pilus assembly protein [Myxococcus dinghuensis]